MHTCEAGHQKAKQKKLKAQQTSPGPFPPYLRHRSGPGYLPPTPTGASSSSSTSTHRQPQAARGPAGSSKPASRFILRNPRLYSTRSLNLLRSFTAPKAKRPFLMSTGVSRCASECALSEAGDAPGARCLFLLEITQILISPIKNQKKREKKEKFTIYSTDTLYIVTKLTFRMAGLMSNLYQTTLLTISLTYLMLQLPRPHRRQNPARSPTDKNLQPAVPLPTSACSPPFINCFLMAQCQVIISAITHPKSVCSSSYRAVKLP